ncbi:zinc-binding protein A33-like isoform X2 [Rhinatrema bivittatum]|uniref:zinc-binding protein A33-like isoform X2 n=1 Tax=Rhinatrema bivittatum TaxID=194408 RepID=UPI001129DCD2|nr:zinc-binding protein A33-like isoform X2 [Rhinatrema bivittatum]
MQTDPDKTTPGGSSSSTMLGPESLRQELLCPICYDTLQDPVILECSHNTCRGCIDRLWGGQAACSCPLCRREHPDKRYTPNHLLGALIQAYLCRMERECQFCQQQEEKLVGETPAPVSQPMQRFVTVEDAAQQYKEKLKATTVLQEHHLQGLKVLQEQQEERVLEIKAQYLTLERNISSQFTEMHHWLQQKEQGMMKELKREEEKLLEEVECTQKSFKEEIKMTEENMSHLKDRLEEQDPAIFLTKITSFVEKFCVERTLPVTAPLKGLSLGQFMGPIQYAVWKEMKSIIQPGGL